MKALKRNLISISQSQVNQDLDQNLNQNPVIDQNPVHNKIEDAQLQNNTERNLNISKYIIYTKKIIRLNYT